MLVIYDDGRGDFGPLTDRRAVFDLRTGALTTRRRIEAAVGESAAALAVPAALAAVQRGREAQAGGGVTVVVTGEAVGDPRPWAGAGEAEVRLVNGRWSGGARLGEMLGDLRVGHALLAEAGGVIAARLTAWDAGAFIESGFTELPASTVTHAQESGVLLERPWHILDQLDATLGQDLATLPGALRELPAADVAPGAMLAGQPGVYVVGDGAVRIAGDALMRPGSVLNTESGPIVIDRGAVVGAGCAVEGPCYLGPGVVLAAHSSIRKGTAVGPACKLGGEISACLIDSHTNKAHAGYLGNAIVGQWCNLGADTNASNLKNTYGPVRVQLHPDRRAEETGRTVQGPILGDLARTAIGTRLLTGSVIGTGSMLAVAGFAPKCVGALRFLTDAADGTVSDQPHQIDKLLATADAMHARRGLSVADHERRHLRDLAERGGV